jgi:hypothetical protein
MPNSAVNPIFTPATWIADARGGLRLASEVDKEAEVHWPQICGQSAANPSSARQNGRKRRRHTSHSVKGVAAHSLHAVISKGP